MVNTNNNNRSAYRSLRLVCIIHLAGSNTNIQPVQSTRWHFSNISRVYDCSFPTTQSSSAKITAPWVKHPTKRVSTPVNRNDGCSRTDLVREYRGRNKGRAARQRSSCVEPHDRSHVALLCEGGRDATGKAKKVISDAFDSFTEAVDELIDEEMDANAARRRRRRRIERFRALSPRTKAFAGAATGTILSPFVLKTSVRTLKWVGLFYVASEIVAYAVDKDSFTFFRQENDSIFQQTRSSLETFRFELRQRLRSIPQPTIILSGIANAFEEEPAASLGFVAGSLLGLSM